MVNGVRKTKLHKTKTAAKKKASASAGRLKKRVKRSPPIPKRKSTRVTVRYDAGFNNHLYIRGNGAGLTWDHGALLKNIGPDEWVWETDLSFGECEFKVLLNDQQYEDGENHHLNGGIWLQYAPHF